MKVVVTGAAGFVGSTLARRLEAAGHEATGLDCFTDYYDVGQKEANAEGLDVLDLDLAADELDFTGFDGVFHLAGQPGVRSFGEAFDNYARQNLLATQRVFEACSSARVRVVFASSSSIYGQAEAYPTGEDVVPQPISPYGITKLGCEQLAHAYRTQFDLDAVVLRYFTVYGPRQRPDMLFRRVCQALLDGTPFEIYGSGEQSRSFTYVDDAVAATIAAMENAPDGSVLNVGGGEEATVNDAIALLEEASGRTLDLRHVGTAKGDVSRTSADVTRIGELIGWRPTTSLAEGLREMWSWASARVAAG
jgi:UDP-glucuronate 4-epimerase